MGRQLTLGTMDVTIKSKVKCILQSFLQQYTLHLIGDANVWARFLMDETGFTFGLSDQLF